MDVNSKLKMRFSAGSPFWISRFHCISAWLTKNDGKSLPDKVVQRIVKKTPGLQRRLWWTSKDISKNFSIVCSSSAGVPASSLFGGQGTYELSKILVGCV